MKPWSTSLLMCWHFFNPPIFYFLINSVSFISLSLYLILKIICAAPITNNFPGCSFFLFKTSFTWFNRDSYNSLDADIDLINEKMLSSLILLLPRVGKDCMKRGGVSVSDI